MSVGAPTLTTVLGTWQATPVADVVVAAAAVGYAILLARLHRMRQRAWPWRRSAAAALAVLGLVVALDGPVGVYGEMLFWVHMVQHLLMIMVVPVLLVWAQPLRLLHEAGGPRVRVGLDRVLEGRTVRWLTAPAFSIPLYAAVVVLTHLTGFQQLALAHGGVRAVELALYLVSGYLLFLPLVATEYGPYSMPHLIRLALLVVAMGVDTLTGVALMLTSHPLAPGYALTHVGWGPTVLADQNWAGAVMWWGGDVLMMIVLIVVGVQWGLADHDRQGLGSWLERARREALFGDEHAGSADVDNDQDALDAYNATLAQLHDLPPTRRKE